ncbi:MAG TPA: penicillin-binding protein activator [Reyranella sp.]|jgi:branched-chain amino acid transport system substrate-binding protein|nr:penicillin-binding protein activator [Reyranella sp.]
MRPLLALATIAFLLGACTETPKPTITTPPKPTGPVAGSPTTPSGKARIALLLPLSGRSAAIGQSMQQAAELALFDTGAKELALAAYDAGESGDATVQAYKRAQADGCALILGPLFGASATALGPLRRADHTNIIAFSNDESVAQPGLWVMGIAAPPQVRRVVDYTVSTGIKRFAVLSPRSTYGEQMARALESHVSVRGGTVVASETYNEGNDISIAAKRLADATKGEGKLAILLPIAPPRLNTVLASLSANGVDPKSVQLIGTGVWDTPGIGSDPMLRGAWYAAPDPARRADFERKYVATYGRPPQRLATLAYDAVSLAAQLARLKPGGDFSAEAIANPNGWSGVDGVFRLLPDGRTERALAVIEVQGDRGVVVSPAPTSFTSSQTN